MQDNQFYDDYQSPLGYRALKNGYDTYGVDHSQFTTREEVEYQATRIKREKELMQQQRNMGITGNYIQYGTNFWNKSPENNYGFGGSETSKNPYANSLQEKQEPIPPLNQCTTDMVPNSELSNIMTPNPLKQYATKHCSIITPGDFRSFEKKVCDINSLSNTNQHYLYNNDNFKDTIYQDALDRSYPNLSFYEGNVGGAYLDSEYKPTVGIGYLINSKERALNAGILNKEQMLNPNVDAYETFKTDTNNLKETLQTKALTRKNYRGINQNPYMYNDNTIPEIKTFQEKYPISPEKSKELVDDYYHKEGYKNLINALDEYQINFNKLAPEAQEVLLDIAYNHGVPLYKGIGQKSGWHNLLTQLKEGDYYEAAQEIHRKNIQNSRNSANYMKMQQASGMVPKSLDVLEFVKDKNNPYINLNTNEVTQEWLYKNIYRIPEIANKYNK